MLTTILASARSRTIALGGAVDAEQRTKLLEIADKTPMTKTMVPGVSDSHHARGRTLKLDPAIALQLSGFDRKPRHGVFDSVPVVQPRALHNVIVLSFTNFPAVFVRVVDNEFPRMSATEQSLRKYVHIGAETQDVECTGMLPEGFAREQTRTGLCRPHIRTIE